MKVSKRHFKLIIFCYVILCLLGCTSPAEEETSEEIAIPTQIANTPTSELATVNPSTVASKATKSPTPKPTLETTIEPTSPSEAFVDLLMEDENSALENTPIPISTEVLREDKSYYYEIDPANGSAEIDQNILKEIAFFGGGGGGGVCEQYFDQPHFPYGINTSVSIGEFIFVDVCWRSPAQLTITLTHPTGIEENVVFSEELISEYEEYGGTFDAVFKTTIDDIGENILVISDGSTELRESIEVGMFNTPGVAWDDTEWFLYNFLPNETLKIGQYTPCIDNSLTACFAALHEIVVDSNGQATVQFDEDMIRREGLFGALLGENVYILYSEESAFFYSNQAVHNLFRGHGLIFRNASVFDEPADSALEIGEVEYLTVVNIIGETGGSRYTHIQTEDGAVDGWVHQSDIVRLGIQNALDFECDQAPRTRLNVGMQARVAFTSGSPNTIRASPGVGNRGEAPEGSVMYVVGGPECINNIVWWEVVVEGRALIGWTAEGKYVDSSEEYWLEPYLEDE